MTLQTASISVQRKGIEKVQPQGIQADLFGNVVENFKAQTNDAADTDFEAVNEIIAERNIQQHPALLSSCTDR